MRLVSSSPRDAAAGDPTDLLRSAFVAAVYKWSRGVPPPPDDDDLDLHGEGLLALMRIVAKRMDPEELAMAIAVFSAPRES